MDEGGWLIPLDLAKIDMMQSMNVSLMNLSDLFGPILDAKPEAASARRVIIWGRNDLLVQAVGSFLKSSHWNIVPVPGDLDADVLLHETKRLQPEVVILCREEADESALAFRLINEQACSRVITLGLDSNLMQVYNKQDIFLRGAADLLYIIENGHFPNCIPGKEAEAGKQDF